MPKTRVTAGLIAGLIAAAALILVIDRGGLIAWTSLILGASLLAKTQLKPSGLDPLLSIGLATVSVLAWIGTFYYVISTWESGEVVELVINADNGTHTARVWVLDIGKSPVVYYDAEPEVARSLLDGRPLQLTRADVISTRIPAATRVDELPEATANRIFEAMNTKYGDRVDAADVYYLMLGRSTDRIAVVADLVEARDSRQ